MIIDLFLLVIQGILNVLLMPLSVVNVAIDFVGTIPLVTSFVQIVCYILPWTNLLPLFSLTFALFFFRISLVIFRFLKGFIPFIGG